MVDLGRAACSDRRLPNNVDKMTDSDLCYISAAEALSQFRARKLSPVDLLKAQIARAERVEPIVNAFSDTYFDRALAEARRAEARYMRTDGRLRALEGLTVAVKDTMDVKGQRNTQGSLLYKDYVATETHPLVERLLKAGAILHARSTIPEFCCAWITTSRLFGTTHNPWNRDYFPCGSSGGSAAALAAGTTMLATGTDIGSISIRMSGRWREPSPIAR
jgi:Asp-tRNA(Asn)/Glu-tRNA(Gln) amidotransferase A subunit family amidase